MKEDAVLVDRGEPEHFEPSVLRTIDAAAVLVTLTLIVAVSLELTGAVRVLLTLAFVTFVPGWAVFGYSRLADGTSRVALAVAASLTICTTTALAMAWLRAWHPFALFYALAAASVVPLVGRSARRAASTIPAPVAEEPVAEEPATEEPATEEPATEEPATEEPATEERVPVPHDPLPVRATRADRPVATAEPLPLTSMTVRVAFLARPAFAGRELTDFFAAIQDTHPFTDFHRDAAGAVLAVPGSRRLEIRRDAVVYRETAPLGFQDARRRTVDLLSEVRERLGVPFLANPSFLLQATVASPVVRVATAGVDPALTAVLGSSTPVAIGLSLAGSSDAPRYTWRLALAPDAIGGRLAVDLTTDFDLPAAGPGAIGEHLQQSHHFLVGNVVRFVESLGASPGD